MFINGVPHLCIYCSFVRIPTSPRRILHNPTYVTECRTYTRIVEQQGTEEFILNTLQNMIYWVMHCSDCARCALFLAFWWWFQFTVACHLWCICRFVKVDVCNVYISTIVPRDLPRAYLDTYMSEWHVVKLKTLILCLSYSVLPWHRHFLFDAASAWHIYVCAKQCQSHTCRRTSALAVKTLKVGNVGGGVKTFACCFKALGITDMFYRFQATAWWWCHVDYVSTSIYVNLHPPPHSSHHMCSLSWVELSWLWL